MTPDALPLKDWSDLELCNRLRAYAKRCDATLAAACAEELCARMDHYARRPLQVNVYGPGFGEGLPPEISPPDQQSDA